PSVPAPICPNSNCVTSNCIKSLLFTPFSWANSIKRFFNASSIRTLNTVSAIHSPYFFFFHLIITYFYPFFHPPCKQSYFVNTCILLKTTQYTISLHMYTIVYINK